MELFYAESVDGSILMLGPEESAHCAKVLRHRTGDLIPVAVHIFAPGYGRNVNGESRFPER